jgi:hypothetical protein
MLSWNDGIADRKDNRIVILKPMFELDEMREDPALKGALTDDITSECARFGVVEKVTVFDVRGGGGGLLTEKETPSRRRRR